MNIHPLLNSSSAVLTAGLVAASMCLPQAHAVTIVHGSDSVDIDFVDIGNAGNVADTNGKGAVSYEYSIGTYEITSSQWATVTTADANIETGTNPDPYTGSQPTASVSWYEAAKFANWLTSGDALLGAYQFSDATTFTGVDRATALSTYQTIYVIPNEDEWYKAAYLKSDGSGYTDYTTGDTAPTAGIDSNFGNVNTAPWNVGSGSVENNGTYDMGGNVQEWSETPYFSGGDHTAGLKPYGGDYTSGSPIKLYWGGNSYSSTSGEFDTLGFRVASLSLPPSAVPEPSSGLLVIIGGMGALLRRKRG